MLKALFKLFRELAILLTIAAVFSAPAPAQEEPPLPAGLKGGGPQAEEEPELPAGLAPEKKPGLPSGLVPEKEPALPSGLAPAKEPAITRGPAGRKAEPLFSALPFEVSGFWELRVGGRLREDPYERDLSIGETRVQLEIEKPWTWAVFRLTADFLFDPVVEDYKIRLEEGRGWIDLREASISFSPTSFIDVKLGRQILTWGTGDLLFLNDLFPKDWKAFFAGRDPEYLKAPSDAIRCSLFAGPANLDVAFTPRFDSDRFIDGRRISFFNERLGRRSGRDAPVAVDKPQGWFEDFEVGWRLYGNLKAYEIALYGYRGFWKSPAGMDPATGTATFPRLSAYGASARGKLLRGIGYAEISYYDSEDDRDGSDPFVRNSEFRALVGYEQEAAREFTVGFQYYLEHMMDYGEFLRTRTPGGRKASENRHLLTLRLTKLLMNQNLVISLFTFYSPSDQDAYLRPRIHYKIDDHLSAEVGGNIFVGRSARSFFGQFARNTNLYFAARYSF